MDWERKKNEWVKEWKKEREITYPCFFDAKSLKDKSAQQAWKKQTKTYFHYHKP